MVSYRNPPVTDSAPAISATVWASPAIAGTLRAGLVRGEAAGCGGGGSRAGDQGDGQAHCLGADEAVHDRGG